MKTETQGHLKPFFTLKLAILERYGSQRNFAQTVGVTENDLSRIVQGRQRLSRDKQGHWAMLLNRKREHLFGTNEN